MEGDFFIFLKGWRCVFSNKQIEVVFGCWGEEREKGGREEKKGKRKRRRKGKGKGEEKGERKKESGVEVHTS